MLVFVVLNDEFVFVFEVLFVFEVVPVAFNELKPSSSSPSSSSPESVFVLSDEELLELFPVKSLKISPSKKGLNNKAVMTWSSSNPKVAVVDEKGTVTGVTRGTSVITVTCDGLSASYNVSVTPNKPKISTDDGKTASTLVVSKDDEKNLEFQDEFSSISPDEVEWSSNKEAVCTVDQNG